VRREVNEQRLAADICLQTQRLEDGVASGTEDEDKGRKHHTQLEHWAVLDRHRADLVTAEAIEITMIKLIVMLDQD
jgi:hypothetical protein